VLTAPLLSNGRLFLLRIPSFSRHVTILFLDVPLGISASLRVFFELHTDFQWKVIYQLKQHI
jgi:hypothetical protein